MDHIDKDHVKFVVGRSRKVKRIDAHLVRKRKKPWVGSLALILREKTSLRNVISFWRFIHLSKKVRIGEKIVKNEKN